MIYLRSVLQLLADLVRIPRRLDHVAPGYVTASGAGPQLVIASPDVATASTSARTITGLVVPFGASGQTSAGRLTFSAGSLTWTDPKRVKLLREHDQGDVLGYATELTETPAGVVATFHVPEGENGDRALVEAANGLRDAFSVGVQLDDATMTRLRRSQGAPVAAAGALREVSQVSVPAFDDARLAASGVDLVVSTWTTATPDTTTTTHAGAAGTTREDTTTVNRRQRLAALRALENMTQAEAAELHQLAALPDAELDQPHEPASATASTAVTTPQQPATASAGQGTGQVAGPSVVPAVAGAAVVTNEPATYTFAGDGHSIVRDLYNSAMRGDGEAAQRVERFNAELSGGNRASVAAFVTAAATRDDYDGNGTDVPQVLAPDPRPILKTQLDAKRPFIGRLDTVPITNAQPFAVPGVEVEFDGVGDHTEGTPHRPAGKLTLEGGSIVQPKAVSGAWEVSRELVDATNPVIDRIAARAMLNDYRRKSEGGLVTLLAARAAQEGASIYGVDTLIKLRGAMIDFVNEDDEGADLVALSGGLFRTYGTELDADDRPQLPFIGAVNAVGTIRAGYTGVAIDGVEMFQSKRLDAVAAFGPASGLLARSEGIMFAESPVLQFRFDEVMGPGVIKLALWAYNAAAILDVADVMVLRAGADPTP